MNKKFYRIYWTRSDYGHIDIQASTEQEAREKFEQGNYKDVDLYIKGGEMTIDNTQDFMPCGHTKQSCTKDICIDNIPL